MLQFDINAYQLLCFSLLETCNLEMWAPVYCDLTDLSFFFSIVFVYEQTN